MISMKELRKRKGWAFTKTHFALSRREKTKKITKEKNLKKMIISATTA